MSIVLDPSIHNMSSRMQKFRPAEHSKPSESPSSLNIDLPMAKLGSGFLETLKERNGNSDEAYSQISRSSCHHCGAQDASIWRKDANGSVCSSCATGKSIRLI